MTRTDIVTVVGARPQFIKSGPVSRAFDRSGVREMLVHTGQHFDLNMSDVFFEEMGLRKPSAHLGLGGGGHGTQTGRMLEGIENLLLESDPRAVLVYGDTNSTVAGALAAVKLHIPVLHFEAGLRSFNRQMPEEINRVVTDHVSTVLLCPTPVAVDHLANEGIVENVYMVGDVMQDGVNYWKDSHVVQVDERSIEPYYLATLHRAENVDYEQRLTSILEGFQGLNRKVVLPLHPRTARRIDEFGLAVPTNVELREPLGYLEMLRLQAGALAILTDSGGVQKEAYMLGVPCITLRTETEWTETVDAGWNTIAGHETEAIVRAVNERRVPSERPALYGDGNASGRIAEIAMQVLG